MSTSSKAKKENWTGEEVAVLLEEVEKRKPYLFGKLSGFLTNDRKKAQWREVVASVNAVSKTNRTEAETTKKWRTLKSKIKTKEGERQQELKKTGGGVSAVPGDPSPMEQKVLGIIGQVCVRGIAGGIDSGATEAANSKDVDGSVKQPFSEGTYVNNLDEEENQLPAMQKKSSDKRGACHLQSASASKAVSPDDDTPVDDDIEELEQPARKRRRAPRVMPASDRLVRIEAHRLEIEKERLSVEKERLQIEKKRLEIEQERLKLEQHNYSMTSGRSLIDNSECTYFALQ